MLRWTLLILTPTKAFRMTKISDRLHWLTNVSSLKSRRVLNSYLDNETNPMPIKIRAFYFTNCSNIRDEVSSIEV